MIINLNRAIKCWYHLAFFFFYLKNKCTRNILVAN